LLQERFHQAKQALADRYSEPLQAAIRPYLHLLQGNGAGTPTALDPELGFDPQQGFDKLQLRQGPEAYAFERLSGGMQRTIFGSRATGDGGTVDARLQQLPAAGL